MKVRSIILCIGMILCVFGCARMVRPTKLNRIIVETEIADLNTDFYPESIIISPDVKHIAFIEDVYSGLRVVVDDNPQESYDDIARGMQFSPSNDYVAYFAYYEGYSGGIFGLFATDPFWAVVVDESSFGQYQDLLNNSIVISPNAKHVAYGVFNFINAKVYFDHQALPDFICSQDDTMDSVMVYNVLGPFVFSPNSLKFAYVAETVDSDKWAYAAIMNNVAGKGYKYVYPYSLTFSSDSEKLAYVVQDSIVERVVVNGEELTGYESVPEVSIRFSPDSEHLAYVAFDGENWFVVQDEIEGVVYDAIGTIVFSPDSKHLAYTAQDDEEWIVIKDKREIARHTGIIEKTLKFSPDSKHLVYAAAVDSGVVVYEDGKPLNIYEALVTPPIFSSDGRYLAYTIEENDTQFVVINGVKGQSFPAIISYNGGRIVFDDDNHIHYLAVKDDDKVYLVEESF